PADAVVAAIVVPRPGAQGESRESLEQFLVEFIVEQTGYPPEVVDLDADLEAELGIDSIRKAQLIGELRELNAQSLPLLKNVRTLRQILELIADGELPVPRDSQAAKAINRDLAVPSVTSGRQESRIVSPANLEPSIAVSPFRQFDLDGQI